MNYDWTSLGIGLLAVFSFLLWRRLWFEKPVGGPLTPGNGRAVFFGGFYLGMGYSFLGWYVARVIF